LSLTERLVPKMVFSRDTQSGALTFSYSSCKSRIEKVRKIWDIRKGRLGAYTWRFLNIGKAESRSNGKAEIPSLEARRKKKIGYS